MLLQCPLSKHGRRLGSGTCSPSPTLPHLRSFSSELQESCPLSSYASGPPASSSSTRTSEPPEEGGRKKYALISRAFQHHPSPPQPPVSALSIPHSLPQLRAPPLQQRGTTPTAEQRNARWRVGRGSRARPRGLLLHLPSRAGPSPRAWGPPGATPGPDPLPPTQRGQLRPAAAPQRG